MFTVLPSRDISNDDLQNTEDGGAYLYMELMRSVYKLANSTIAPLSTNLLETLFENLKDDSLAFLAGLWTNSVNHEIRVAALHHAAAFLEAHRSMEQFVDFQTILPSLCVALQTLDTRGKEAAFGCISQMVLLTEKPFSVVYGFDTIYGDSSGRTDFLV
jgi:U3 small nucleolar RNA-associated protein 10